MRTLRARLLVLVGLILISVGLTAAGVGFGVDDALADSEPGGEFVVSESNVTLIDRDGESTVVSNLTATERVRITESSDAFAVEIRPFDPAEPLSERERERAAAIAQTNDTVAAYLDRTEDATLSVEPIAKVTGDESHRGYVAIDVDPNGSTDSSGEFTIETDDVETGQSSVTVTTEPSYIEDAASIRVDDPDDDLRYSLRVNLTAERIEEFTDWSTVGRASGTPTAATALEPNADEVSNLSTERIRYSKRTVGPSSESSTSTPSASNSSRSSSARS